MPGKACFCAIEDCFQKKGGKFRKLFSRITIAFLLTLLSAGIAMGQAERQGLERAPEFDLREQTASGQAGGVSSSDRGLVQRRRAAVETFLAAENARQPGLRITLNQRGLPKLYLRDGGSLSLPSTQAPVELAKSFLRARAGLFQLSATEIDSLRLTVQDMTPQATFLVFNQTLNGVDVFEGHVKFTLTPAGEIVQVALGEVIPGLSLPTIPRLRAEEALRLAMQSVSVRSASPLEILSTAARRTAFRNPFGGSFSPLTADLCIFPLDAATGRLAYRVFLETAPQSWYEIVIDAENGGLLYRHNLYVYAAQARVWTQSPMQSSRSMVTFPDSWLPPNATVTTGNNADVYIDADGDDHPDPISTGDLNGGRPYSASQIFDFPFGDGLTGQDPRQSKAAAATNLFYFINTAHDYYYSLGFTEAAGAFQTDHFGKGGGSGNDAVLGEAQFGGFTNDAAFAPTPEGVAPRIRMALFTRGTADLTDDLDSDYDGEVVVHEYGHGVSNRLVGAGTSTSCLTRIQSGALGEGWSDYFSISFFNNPVEGAYLTQNLTAGIRRQSYEGYTFTYEDIGNAGYEVHNDGEIWAATLWDLRKVLSQAVVDKLVLNGLKGTPCHPSMTDARDAILSADQATNGGANRAALWQVFARHGLGYSALGVDGTLLTGTRYDAAADLPPDLQPLRNPAVTSDPLQLSTSLGSLYSYAITASNPSSGTLAFALTQGPAGMTVDSASGALQWTAGFVGQRVKIVITDGRGGRVVHGYLLAVLTNLNAGAPIIIQGDKGTLGFATLTVAPNTPVLQITLRDGTGDADLFVVSADGKFAYSARNGNNETLSFAGPKAGTWLIEIAGYAAYNAVKLTGTLVTPAVLGLNATVTNLSGIAGSETLYRIPVPAGATALQVATSGGSGDVDLFMKYGSPALCQESRAVSTACSLDKFSANPGNNDSIVVANPAAGDWYLDLSGFEDYSDVTLTTVTTIPPTLVVTPAALSFTVVQGGPSPAAQSLSISNASGSAYSWTASAATTSGGSWLQLSQTSGSADSRVQVSVNPTGLGPGSYSGGITVTAAMLAGSPRTLAVTLLVTMAPSLAVAPASLTFQTTAGQDSAPQTITVTNGGGGSLNWSAAASTNSGGTWLQLSSSGGSNGGSVQVMVKGAGLAAGSYSGTVTITASGAFNSPLAVPISVTVAPAGPVPTISAAGVTGAGGSSPPVTQISPGGFATVKGVNFAADGTSRVLQPGDFVNGNLPTQLAGVCVDVDGLPAFLTYVGSSQVNFVVPAVRTGVSVDIQVRSNCGQPTEIRSAAASVSAQAASPEFLYWAHPDSGQNPVIAVNAASGALVGPSSLIAVLTPAKPGDYLTIYGVSFGSTTPAYAPGSPPAGTGSVAGPLTVHLGDADLSAEDVLYAGVSPGTAGLYQLNIHLPPDLAAGNYALTLSYGTFRTPAGYLAVEH